MERQLWHKNSLSLAYHELRRSEEAVGYSRRALSIVREIGDRHGEGITLTKLGAALCAEGRTETARRCWRDAVAILEGLASPKAAEARMLLERLYAGEKQIFGVWRALRHEQQG